MKRGDFRFLDRLRVRWAEVDMQQIVFNAHYLTYFDNAVGGYWRALALPYQDAMRHLQGDLYMRKSVLEYEGSAHFDDLCEVGVRCMRIGNSSLLLGAALLRGERRLVRGELLYVFADPATQTARPVPPDLRRLIERYEAGASVVDVRLGSWDELGREAQAVRTAVFVDEQKIPAELEWDAADASGVHAVAFNGLGMALATGRLLEHSPGVARIGRMAVLATVRGANLGSAVLDSLAGVARQRGDRELLLHAQASAAGFYERQGFNRRGAMFEEAGIPHVEMVRSP